MCIDVLSPCQKTCKHLCGEVEETTRGRCTSGQPGNHPHCQAFLFGAVVNSAASQEEQAACKAKQCTRKHECYWQQGAAYSSSAVKIVSNRLPGSSRLDSKTDTGIEYYAVIIWNSLDTGHLSANCTKFQRSLLDRNIEFSCVVWCATVCFGIGDFRCVAAYLSYRGRCGNVQSTSEDLLLHSAVPRLCTSGQIAA